jgi:predicted transcriptional regulator
MRTIDDLPKLVTTVSEAFSQVQSEEHSNRNAEQSAVPASLLQSPSITAVATAYPSIQSSGGCADAVMRLLATGWGRVAPRTLPEIVEAMRANAVHYPATTLSGVLNWLVRKGKVKRWKKDKGYVYVLAQANAMPSQPLMQTQSETIDASAAEGEEVG